MKLAGALLCTLAACAAAAQAPDCPKPLEVVPAQLFGLWHAEVEGLAQGATLLFEKHPEYADSVSGGINRNGERGVVSGEIQDGEFSLEESADGVHIAATWIGEIVEGSCGREIRGTWQRDGETRSRPFVMRRR
jgi:hypothetical protein